MTSLELWGGVECTVNRVRDRYHDQMRRNGHLRRLDDLDRFASLGFKALRQPVIWEHVAQGGFTPYDPFLAKLCELGIRPIVTLLHHGSGPPDTSLIDDGFPAKLAAHARKVAERYPWVEDYTPVNEPLTTARFSGLYGHWYPHGRDYRVFLRALYNECLGTALAMREIRKVNPRARLIQTEDMGETFSTPRLAEQARFENQRRWLGFDLLLGHLTEEHPFRRFVTGQGLTEVDLDRLEEAPCPPDVIALNYYLTSDRVLDERQEMYPGWSHGDENHRYADVEAVRAWGPGIAGHRALLERAWHRYKIPVALGEVHLGCTREEQLRWVNEAWQACLQAREQGADVRALTLWSLLGAFDWNKLVVEESGFYEPGVYDIRGPEPRETALAHLARELSLGQTPRHPLLESAGFWRRPERIFWGPAPRSGPSAPAGRPLLITGATGTLGQAFARACVGRCIAARLTSRRELDAAVRESVRDALDRVDPWAVINTAGYVRVDDAEDDVERCLRENQLGAAVLAEECAARGLPFLTFSSDLVFDGSSEAAYVETDRPAPVCVYGRSKALAEAAVVAAHPGALVVRTAAFFGPWDPYNFVSVALRELAAMRPFRAAEDLVVSPTYVPDLVETCLDLFIDRAAGIWHVAGPDALSWADFARRVARRAGLDEALVHGTAADRLGLRAPRPRQSALRSARGVHLPALDDALDRYFAGLLAEPRAAAVNEGGRTTCGGGDACPGHGRCRVHR